MNIQSELKSFDRALQKVEFDIEWNMEQSDLVKDKLNRQIKTERLKSQTFKLFRYVSTVGIAFAFLSLVITQLITPDSFLQESISSIKEFDSQKLYTMEVINGQETPVLTEKGMEYIIYPMDAHTKIDTIVGEPIIVPRVENIGNKEMLFIQAFYPTSSEGRFINIHNVENNKDSVEEMISLFVPDQPLYGRIIREVKVAGQHAVLYEPTTKFGTAQLFIVTEKYVYYMSNEGLMDKKQGDGEELMKLASLFNFDAER